MAQVAALSRPKRLDGLILSNTGGRLGYDVVFPDWAPEATRAAVGTLFENAPSDDAAFAETWRAALPAYWRDPDPDVLARVHDATTYRAEALLHSFTLLGAFDTLDALASLEVPTLVLSGADDFITAAEAGEDLADALPNAELVVIEGAGHFPFFSAPVAYVEAVEN